MHKCKISLAEKKKKISAMMKENRLEYILRDWHLDQREALPSFTFFSFLKKPQWLCATQHPLLVHSPKEESGICNISMHTDIRNETSPLVYTNIAPDTGNQ